MPITKEQTTTVIEKALIGRNLLPSPRFYHVCFVLSFLTTSLILPPLTAREGSYSPYSNFRVGACLIAEDGTYVLGANVGK